MLDLLPIVLAGHFIGDWIVQTDEQAANKATSWWANQRHMAGYHTTMWIFFCLACILHGVEDGAWLALRDDMAIIIAVSWVTHSIIDRRWPVIWLMRHTGSEPFSKTPWGPMAVDQALHLGILCLAVAAVQP
jgi:hypothetical protein